MGERRGGRGAKGLDQEEHGPTSTSRTQSRIHEVSQELACVRERARKDKKTQFTALLHRLSLDQLRQSFYGLQKQAAPGADGVAVRRSVALTGV